MRSESGSERSEASILHADLDSFYASVEQRDQPHLRGKPVAVGGGIILAASYEAKAFGVYTPMPEWRAKRVCPGLIVIPPRFEAYTEASKAVFDVFHDTTPLVEALSIDEAFLDVAGLARIAGAPPEIARRLRARVRELVDLPISVGVARTKFLAKVASAVSKPDGLIVVDPAGEDDFLLPLKVERLWGVGPVTAAKLHARGLHTVADVAAVSEGHLVGMLGDASGHHLYRLAHHLDHRSVDTERRRRSIGSQHALGRGDRTHDEIRGVLLAAVDRVASRMRSAERVGSTITVRFRYRDMRSATRAHTLDHPTAATDAIAKVATAIFDAEWAHIETAGLTLIGVSVGNLSDGDDEPMQLQLPLGDRRPEGRDLLDAAVDALHERFGNSSIRRGSSLGAPERWEMPRLGE